MKYMEVSPTKRRRAQNSRGERVGAVLEEARDQWLPGAFWEGTSRL